MVKEIHFEKQVTAEDIYHLNLYNVYEEFDAEEDEANKIKVGDMEAEEDNVELTVESNQVETGEDLVRKAEQIVEAKERDLRHLEMKLMKKNHEFDMLDKNLFETARKLKIASDRV